MATCPDCGGALVGFAVPPALREFAPDEAAAATICARCLRVRPAASPPDEDPAFDRVFDGFPTGEAGVAFALLLGALPSLTLRKDDVRALRERTERAGADVALALDRLAAVESVDPHFDLSRRTTQLEQLVG